MAARLLSLQRPRRATISPLIRLFSLHRTPPQPHAPPPPGFVDFPRKNGLIKKHEVTDRIPAYGLSKKTKSIYSIRFCCIHASQLLSCTNQTVAEPENSTGNVVIDANANTKVKRKKLKGKRAVVRWLKHFRWKKKKEYERMAAEEKILYKLRKALDKSKYRDALRAVQKYIPKLHQDLEDLQVRMKMEGENKVKTVSKKEAADTEDSNIISRRQFETSDGSEETEEPRNNVLDIQSDALSETSDLSDIFDTDSEAEREKGADQHLYLDKLDMFPSDDDDEPENFEEHLRQICASVKRGDSSAKDATLEEFDEIDKIFLRAESLLKKRRK